MLLFLDGIGQSDMGYNDENQQQLTPFTVWNYCLETSSKLENLTIALEDVLLEKHEMTLDLIEKEGMIVVYEDKIRQLSSRLQVLEK